MGRVMVSRQPPPGLSHEDRLVVLDPISGDERVFPSPVKGSLVRTPAVSPDGRSVVFQVFRQGTWLLDFSDGTMRRILEESVGRGICLVPRWSPNRLPQSTKRRVGYLDDGARAMNGVVFTAAA